MQEVTELRKHIDLEGRLTQWPSKRTLQLVALDYLATKLELDKVYTEGEINALLNQWHTFDDPALLHRELFEAGYLNRQKDGTEYWRTPRTKHF
jgi:hypothetical protein